MSSVTVRATDSDRQFMNRSGVLMAGAGDIAWRLSDYHTWPCTPPGLAALSLIVAAAVKRRRSPEWGRRVATRG
jgi:hypothetical protein